MKGAREYAELFKSGQYGRLYIASGHHARGSTFHIQVLPEGEIARQNGYGNLCTNADAVEVYGVVSGNPGWTEEYGWLLSGLWCPDFETMCLDAAAARDSLIRKHHRDKEARIREESSRINKLLETYR